MMCTFALLILDNFYKLATDKETEKIIIIRRFILTVIPVSQCRLKASLQSVSSASDEIVSLPVNKETTEVFGCAAFNLR